MTSLCLRAKFLHFVHISLFPLSVIWIEAISLWAVEIGWSSVHRYKRTLLYLRWIISFLYATIQNRSNLPHFLILFTIIYSFQLNHTASPLKTIYFPHLGNSANCMQLRRPTSVGQMAPALPTKAQGSPTSLSQEETPYSPLTSSGLSRSSGARDGTPITSEQVYSALASLGIVGVSSAVLCVLCVQVLLSAQYCKYFDVFWRKIWRFHFIFDAFRYGWHKPHVRWSKITNRYK